MAALIGAYGGMSLQIALTSALEAGAPDWSELWAIPVMIFWYGLFALPFVSLGLAIFGIPAASLFRRWRSRSWIALVAATSGAVTGKLFYHAIDQLMFFGNDRLWPIEPVEIGFCYGIPTGLAWWWFKRDD